ATGREGSDRSAHRAGRGRNGASRGGLGRLDRGVMRRSGSLSLIAIVVLAAAWLGYTLTIGGHTPQLGLDLQGGSSVVLAPREKATSGQLDQAISIIRRRVDGLGVAEPEITRQGNFIVVSLPGVKDRDRAIAVVGQTAKLQFRPFCGSLPANQDDTAYQQALDPYGGCSATSSATTTTTAAPAAESDSTSTTAPDQTTTTATSAPPASWTGLGIPPLGHLSAAQQPPSTDTTGAPPPSDTGSTTTAAPGSTTTAPGQVPAEPSTVAANPLPCGQTGDRASITPDNQPIVALDD